MIKTNANLLFVLVGSSTVSVSAVSLMAKTARNIKDFISSLYDLISKWLSDYIE